jgi:multiple sugar transport system substrate-binding protein/sn-glycerol 3-phosphate transport system substrate-binding protein
MSQRQNLNKFKLPSISIRAVLNRWTERLALRQRLPHVDLSPVRERISFTFQPLTSKFQPLISNLQSLTFTLRYVWPVLLVVLAAALAIGAVRFYPALTALAMPNELARFNLVAGQQVALWYSMDSAASDALTGLIDEFNAKNPWSITVVPQNQGAYTRLQERLGTALDGGVAPDLVALYPQHVAAFALDEHIVALDSYLNQPDLGLTRTDLSDFIPALLDGDRNPQFGNQLLSFPIGPDVLALVYNIDWMRSIGYQDSPREWGTFKKVCEDAVGDVNKDKQPDTFGYAFVPEAPTFSAFVLTRGGDLLSADGKRVLFNTLEGEKAMRILRDTFGTRCAYTVPGRNWDRSDFVNAKVMFNIAPSSALPAYQAAIEQGAAFRWGVAALPHTTPDPITPMYGQSWAILKTTPARQLAAWLFIRWFAEPRQSQRWALATYTVPVRRSAVQALQAVEHLDPIFERVLALAFYGHPEPPVAQWSTVSKIVVETMNAVTTGTEPKDALGQAETKANSALQGGTP